MVNYITRAGVDSYLLYGTETTYGTQAGTIASMLGIIQSFDAKPKRNLVRVRGVQPDETHNKFFEESSKEQCPFHSNHKHSIGW
jgi:hypothetical protein